MLDAVEKHSRRVVRNDVLNREQEGALAEKTVEQRLSRGGEGKPGRVLSRNRPMGIGAVTTKKGNKW